MINKIKNIITLLLLFFVIVFLIKYSSEKYNDQVTILSDVKINLDEEGQFIDESIVINTIKDCNPDSIFLNKVLLSHLEDILERNDLVHNVEVYADLRKHITIDVEQKKPIVHIITDADNYYLDNANTLIPFSSNYTPRVLLATGHILHMNHQSICDFAKIINNNSFWKSQITQLYFKKNQEVILIPRVGDHKIYFGLLVDIRNKLDYLYQFYTKIIPIKGWTQYSEVNVKFKDQIICTKK